MITQNKFSLGRRTPKNHPSIKLSGILTGVAPTHPVAVDYLKKMSGWQILGNDQFGDCAAVCWANMRYFVTSMLTPQPNYPDQEQVFTIYRTQNPDFVADHNNPVEDNGMDVQTLLEYLTKNAGPDGAKLLGFALVDLTNQDEIDAALAIFGCLFLGIEVQDANMQDFSDGKPWDYHANSQIDGGHAVLGGGYLGTAKDDVQFITWAKETGMTDKFWNKLVATSGTGEAWVCIWNEYLGTEQFQQGIDLQKLSDAYKEITGRPFPVSILDPSPSPSPVVPAPEPSNNPGCSQLLTKLLGMR